MGRNPNTGFGSALSCCGQIRLDGGERRRTAGGRALEGGTDNLLEGRLFNTSHWCLFDKRRIDDTVEHLAGRAHPGTEHRTMRRSLMMCVVTVVEDRLSRSNPADANNR